MPKKLAVCVLAVLIALLVVIPVGPASAGRITAGPGWCYVVVDYFTVGASVQTTYPYVIISGPTGSLGGEVHCPWPPPIIAELINT